MVKANLCIELRARKFQKEAFEEDPIFGRELALLVALQGESIWKGVEVETEEKTTVSQ